MQSDNLFYKFYYQWWKNIDKSIFTLISLLFIIGLFFSLVSTSLIASDKLYTNSYFFFFKHLVYVLIGISIIFIFSSLNTDQLFKYSIILFFISLFSLFLVPIIGIEVKGSKRWIDLFFLPRFQPIEVLKPFLIITLATILCSNKANIISKYLLSILTITISVMVYSIMVGSKNILFNTFTLCFAFLIINFIQIIWKFTSFSIWRITPIKKWLIP